MTLNHLAVYYINNILNIINSPTMNGKRFADDNFYLLRINSINVILHIIIILSIIILLNFNSK